MTMNPYLNHKWILPYLLLLTTTLCFGQWKKQNLPPLEDMIYFPISKGKNVMWGYTVNYGNDTSYQSAAEYIRTTDGGKTYKTGRLFDNAVDYDYHIQPYDSKTAYLIASSRLEANTFMFRRTTDTGATWTDMPYKPVTFPDLIHFFNDSEGILICDPDSIGANILYTTNGGNTFTRLPQTNVPFMDVNNEFFIIGGPSFVIGNTLLVASLNFETGQWRIWRSNDRGRNWTAGAYFSNEANFIPAMTFSNANNGMVLRGVASETQKPLITTDGGATWQEGYDMPDQVSFAIGAVANTQSILALFMDTNRKMLYSSSTNDLGKTWHSPKDILPYTLDSIFYPNTPAFVYGIYDIVDNNTAWAKFGRDGLYRYESTTPLVAEQPDLDLEIKADNDGLPLYGYVKYTLKVTNRGISPATGVKISWLPPYKRTPNGAGSYAYVSAYSDNGRYDSWNGIWSIDKLNAESSSTATFVLFVVDTTKNISQTAQVIACNEKDLDSSPNNMSGSPKEDDEVGYTAQSNLNTLKQDINPLTPSVLAVSPNPANDKINLAITPNNDNDWTIKIINTLGQTVLSQNRQHAQFINWEVKHLESGLYIIEFQSNDERKVEKLMIQH